MYLLAFSALNNVEFFVAAPPVEYYLRPQTYNAKDFLVIDGSDTKGDGLGR
jgi:hypothetical protein